MPVKPPPPRTKPSLPGTESQPQAAAILRPALPPGGSPSHAYLFHGPRGSGKRRVAQEFAAMLLDDGQRPDVAQRVARGTHPDLTWVRPSGAAEMLVGDIDEPVVAAASRTPFEAPRRVFVIEGADAMNDRAANRLLKTLEEPPAFAHLLLIADRREDVLPTIVSRCQLVRFDPLPAVEIERLLVKQAVAPQTATACARLSLGDAELAQWLARPEGDSMRDAARAFVGAALGRAEPRSQSPWRALLQAADAAGASAGEEVAAATQAELELLPAKERRRREREGAEAARRLQRRRRTELLDSGLRLAELWLRDVLCLSESAPELVHASDNAYELRQDLETLREDGDVRALPRAIEQVALTRLSLTQNASEELALEALHYRLAEAIGPRLGARP